MSAGGPRAAGSRPGERPGERERWDSLDRALSTLRTCRSAAELAECACELAMQACGAAAAAVERVTDGISVPWLRAGRVELLDPSLAGPAVAREVVMASIVVNDVVAGSLHVAGSDLCPDIVASYARALGSMFALVGVRRRAEEQRYALARLRQRLARRGLRLLLDFVPNHIAPDHPWVEQHPEFLISSTESDLAREPKNYTRLRTGRGQSIFAYGRDPYFPGWPDTLQLNYRHPALRQAMLEELSRVAERCDGVRCDLAMLIQPDSFRRTWGERARQSCFRTRA